MTKPTIKIAIADWWDRSNQKEYIHENDILKLLSPYYNFVYDEKPDFLLYSVFGSNHLSYQHPCIKIFYTGENVRTDWNLCDYGVDFDFLNFGNRHLYLPLFALPECAKDLENALIKHQCDEKILEQKTKFCAFMVTNGGGDPIRGEIFDKLSMYKKVDSGGRWRNNIGGAIGDRYNDFRTSKYHWLKDYKFHICFENSSYPGYVTEKLIQAFRAKCVPIYWGDPTLCDEKYAHYRPIFNPKAFINVHNFDSLDSVVKEVERLDNDSQAFLAMLKEPMLLHTPKNQKWLENTRGGGSNFILISYMIFLITFLLKKHIILTQMHSTLKVSLQKIGIMSHYVLGEKDSTLLSQNAYTIFLLLINFYHKGYVCKNQGLF